MKKLIGYEKVGRIKVLHFEFEIVKENRTVRYKSYLVKKDKDFIWLSENDYMSLRLCLTQLADAKASALNLKKVEPKKGYDYSNMNLSESQKHKIHNAVNYIKNRGVEFDTHDLDDIDFILNMYDLPCNFTLDEKELLYHDLYELASSYQNAEVSQLI